MRSRAKHGSWGRIGVGSARAYNRRKEIGLADFEAYQKLVWPVSLGRWSNAFPESKTAKSSLGVLVSTAMAASRYQSGPRTNPRARVRLSERLDEPQSGRMSNPIAEIQRTGSRILPLVTPDRTGLVVFAA